MLKLFETGSRVYRRSYPPSDPYVAEATNTYSTVGVSKHRLSPYTADFPDKHVQVTFFGPLPRSKLLGIVVAVLLTGQTPFLSPIQQRQSSEG